MANYDVDFDLVVANSSHFQAVRMVGENKRVLDVGCWRGDLGGTLRQYGCTVSGVEYDSDAAEIAATELDEVKVADLESTRLSSLFPVASFDVIVFGDVLEHVKDPQSILADSVSLLVPGGRIFISIPNVTHGSLRLALLQGRWNLTDKGLLDATHLRFFSRKGLIDLLDSAGLQADELRATVLDPLGCEVDVDGAALPAGVIEWVRNQPDAFVYQFLVSASPVPDGQEAKHATTVVPVVDIDSVRIRDKYTRADQRHAEREAKRIAKLEDRVARQRQRITQLERQGLFGLLRRVKRKMSR